MNGFLNRIPNPKMDFIDDVRDHREKIDKKNGTIAINICHLLLLLEFNANYVIISVCVWREGERERASVRWKLKPNESMLRAQ